ncbi:MAG TPA: DUF3387 domain-containing protein, partial [bacterium]|nr:DUF3387 domain-containing protein [bacterium]
HRYRDDKLSIKDVSMKIREIVEAYLISQGVNPKIPPLPLFSDDFIAKVNKKTPKAKVEELEYAIREHIEKHFEEDPEFYERFSDRLKKILEEYKENWDLLAQELENLRSEIKKGRESEQTFGLDPKNEMPFFGLLKGMIFGKQPLEQLGEKNIEFLVNLTQDVLSIIKNEITSVDFWENETKQKKLKSYIISHLLEHIAPRRQANNLVADGTTSYMNKYEDSIFNKRNEIAQRLFELAYHIYGGKQHAG